MLLHLDFLINPWCRFFLEWSCTQTLILTWIIQIPYKWWSHEVFCLLALTTASKQRLLKMSFFLLLPGLSQLEPSLSLYNNNHLLNSLYVQSRQGWWDWSNCSERGKREDLGVELHSTVWYPLAACGYWALRLWLVRCHKCKIGIRFQNNKINKKLK